jgi:hypothetical protein
MAKVLVIMLGVLRSVSAPNIACSGQVRALPSLEGIQRLRHFLPLGFICQFPHLPLTLAVGRSDKIKQCL